MIECENPDCKSLNVSVLGDVGLSKYQAKRSFRCDDCGLIFSNLVYIGRDAKFEISFTQEESYLFKEIIEIYLDEDPPSEEQEAILKRLLHNVNVYHESLKVYAAAQTKRDNLAKEKERQLRVQKLMQDLAIDEKAAMEIDVKEHPPKKMGDDSKIKEAIVKSIENIEVVKTVESEDGKSVEVELALEFVPAVDDGTI